MDLFHDRFLLSGVVCMLVIACNQRKDLVDQKPYQGPLSSMDSINTLVSDSANIVLHMVAVRQNDFENGDSEWSEGLFLEQFDERGAVLTTFRANYVYYTQKENLYLAKGNVRVKNLENSDELNTEELFWNPEDETFYTEKFVTIKSGDEVHTGEGLKANQDFTEYQILKPSGSFLLKSEVDQKPL